MQTIIPYVTASWPFAGTQSLNFPLEYFFILWFLALAWVLGVTVVSVFSRLRKGKPIFRPKFPNACFSETWRSGRSFKTFWTRFGGAKNCLWIIVTDRELWVCPHFPFNLGFMPERLGLEHRILSSDILSVEHQPLTFGGTKVHIRFRTTNGNEETFEIAVRDVAAFDQAIQQIRKPSIST